MTDDLKDRRAGCPFCGNADADRLNTLELDKDAYMISCDACGAVGPLAKTGPEAVSSWNRRAETI